MYIIYQKYQRMSTHFLKKIKHTKIGEQKVAKMRKFANGYKTNVLKIIIIGALFFCCCNPFSFTDAIKNTQKVTVWVCLGPTYMIVAQIPPIYICIDSLEKYGEIENGKYKLHFDTLNVFHSAKSVHIYAKNKKIEYESRIPMVFGEKKDIGVRDIVVYVSTENGENEAFCRENTNIKTRKYKNF